MDRFRQRKLRLRFAAALTAVVLAAGGVSYAALQSTPAKLTGNTIQTATANLQISQDGSSYSNSLPGFNFLNLVPGGSAVPNGGYSFVLKNGGNAALQLRFAVSSSVGNPDNVDLSKITIILTPAGGTAQTFSLQSLVAANTSGGVVINTPALLLAGNSQHYSLQVSMAVDAINGSSASLSGIDFAFTGVAQ